MDRLLLHTCAGRVVEIAVYIVQSLLPVSTMIVTYATYVRSPIDVSIPHCLRALLDHLHETKFVRFVLIQLFHDKPHLKVLYRTASVVFPSMAVSTNCAEV